VIVEDAARGQLKEVYEPVDAFGRESKPSLKEYPVIPWQSIDLNQFNLVPKAAKAMLQKIAGRLGNISHYSGRIRARLPLRLRVLHCDRIFRGLDSLPHQ
jgi:hypothetical protein